jgi:hypothetical protein
VDITVPDFPPVGKRGAVSAEEAGVAASYPFRLCGDQWGLDLSCNKHWIKIHLCYKGWSVCLSLVYAPVRCKQCLFHKHVPHQLAHSLAQP